jgi:hypothetical protein
MRPVSLVPVLALFILISVRLNVAADNNVFLDYESLLPPAQEWSGKSESLLMGSDHEWVTPAELTDLSATPGYDDTVAWLRKLVAAAPQLEMVSIGKSLQGRDFWMVIASADGQFTPETLSSSGKPLLLAHAGIHSGEIDGKDAGLMLLRDMTVTARRNELLQGANFLFIPILNVDGHERSSAFSRINQRGPVEMGWRTNARNQNLNRDFTKLDTEGVRAVVRVLNEWKPDLYLDLHVTDGADYQYDITFGGNGDVYRPAIDRALTEYGHEPGPLIFTANGKDMRDGFLSWSGNPRFSNGYGDAIHLPTVLVENHSLKPYKRRVLGTYVLLAETLALLARERDSLEMATLTDRTKRPASIALAFGRNEEPAAEKVPFKGVRSERYTGQVSGAETVRWTGEPVDQELQKFNVDRPETVVDIPQAYIIPAEWTDVAERIALHGIEVQRLPGAQTMQAEIYRLHGAGIAQSSLWTPSIFEGHIRIDPGIPEKQLVETTFPEGSYRIDTDQPLGELVVLMLEPGAPDSFLQWGFFLEIFNRTEYAEAYVLEPLAQAMLEADPDLKRRFEQKLDTDEELATNSYRRLMWFYEQTPFYDQQYLLYPVARIP